jgi:hypothetical protein
MAVVCSKGLIGKTVRIAALGTMSPVMIVTDVDEEGAKKVTVGWLDKNDSYNTATFPSSSLDKADKETLVSKRKPTVTSRKKKR